MKRIAKFYKVSKEQFVKDYLGVYPEVSEAAAGEIYDGIELPVRATTGSAGYDFRTTVDFQLQPGETVMIPTGIRVRMDCDYALFMFPRSGLGFKYRFQLNNTIGVIDSDYFGSANEGHIFVKMTNDSKEGKVVALKCGEAFAQGIFMQYGITEDDDVTGIRDGGFGSTSAK